MSSLFYYIFIDDTLLAVMPCIVTTFELDFILFMSWNKPCWLHHGLTDHNIIIYFVVVPLKMEVVDIITLYILFEWRITLYIIIF